MRRGLIILFLASLSAVVTVPAAQARGSVAIGSANVFSSPGLAVDTAGTAYIAWRGPENGTGSLQFCRLPRGAAACDSRHAIAVSGDSVSRAFVTVSGSRVIVSQYRYGSVTPGMYAFTSNDRGAHFGAGELVGSIPFFEAVYGPGDTLSGVTDASGLGEAFQNAPLGGGAASTFATLSSDHPYNGTVGLINATTPLAVFASGSGAAQTRHYDGSGTFNDEANWTLPQELGVAHYPKLAGGPRGLFLIATNDANSVYARKWTGTNFGPATAIGDGADPATLHAFQDASGRLHVTFVRGDADGLHLIHAVSDDGMAWRSGTFVTQNPGTDGGISATRIATAPDHVGVVAWNSGFEQIRVAAIGPDAPVDPNTKIGKGPKKKSKKKKAKFKFTSTKPGSTFECKLDKHKFSACTSPKKVKAKPGKHKFQVRAVDEAGNVDGSPAKFKWKVLKPHRK